MFICQYITIYSHSLGFNYQTPTCPNWKGYQLMPISNVVNGIQDTQECCCAMHWVQECNHNHEVVRYFNGDAKFMYENRKTSPWVKTPFPSAPETPLPPEEYVYPTTYMVHGVNDTNCKLSEPKFIQIHIHIFRRGTNYSTALQVVQIVIFLTLQNVNVKLVHTIRYVLDSNASCYFI